MSLAESSCLTYQARWEAAYDAFRSKIKTWARNSVHLFPGWSRDDVEQELLEVLHLCVLSYNPLKGATFNSYTQECFKRRISQLKRRVEAKKRVTERGWVDLDATEVRHAVEERYREASAENMAFAFAALRTMVINERRTSTGRRQPRRQASTTVSRKAG